MAMTRVAPFTPCAERPQQAWVVTFASVDDRDYYAKECPAHAVRLDVTSHALTMGRPSPRGSSRW